jgi:hypothetical protein
MVCVKCKRQHGKFLNGKRKKMCPQKGRGRRLKKLYKGLTRKSEWQYREDKRIRREKQNARKAAIKKSIKARVAKW